MNPGETERKQADSIPNEIHPDRQNKNDARKEKINNDCQPRNERTEP